MGFLAELSLWFAKGIKVIKTYFVPLAQIAVQVIPGVPASVNKIVEKVPDMIAAMEQVFPEPGMGKVKLAGVLAMAKAMADTMADVSTGGQAETWAKIQPFIEGMVNGSVAYINSGKE